jgi:patatin-like phospholipase/acyl hydrolase
MSLIDRIDRPGPKKLLAVDGGGIRGVLALGPLKRIEDILRVQSGNKDLLLADYFDYISGTSTGGIIAAGLSIGMKVNDILKFYEVAGPQMFTKANLLVRYLFATFKSGPLAKKLREVFGAETKFGSPDVRTLLMMVMRNATTDSPWPLSNNPYAKYNDPARPDSNLNFPLWQLVRASTAAPTFFPPEKLVLPATLTSPEKEFLFVDGGVTTYNDPAFQMFLMATVDRYWEKDPTKRWKAGVDDMLIVSVGTGTAPNVRMGGLRPRDLNLLYNAKNLAPILMYAAQNQQDILCRVFGKCLSGPVLERELGDLIGSTGPMLPGNKLFTYMRYDAELTREGLDALGCKTIDPDKVKKLDSVGGICDLKTVGNALADKIDPAHFKSFPA